MVEAGVAPARPRGGLGIRLVEVAQHLLDRRVQAVEIEPVEADRAVAPGTGVVRVERAHELHDLLVAPHPLREAAEAQVFSDVDSAYYTVMSNVSLLRGYRGTDGYLQRVTSVRETMSFSYQHGGASLLDFLDAQRDYRAVQLAYINLVGAYLTAAGQLNMAVGREVM